jgi:L-serine dehydratase
MTDSKTYPSLFNDVLGPVMRGPSSSHCAAALRIGRLARDLMDGKITRVKISFDPNGSLATTHTSQGSDMGLFGGLLGWDAVHERLPESEAALRQAGIEVQIEIEPLSQDHPNTYQLVLSNDREQHQITAVSVGGGMIRLVEIDRFPVELMGDRYETLIFSKQAADISVLLAAALPEATVTTDPNGLIRITDIRFPPDKVLTELAEQYPGTTIRKLAPVLPVISQKNIRVPFLTAAEMMKPAANRKKRLWELAVVYESQRGGLSAAKIQSMISEILTLLRRSIREGLAGTAYDDRILGPQSGRFMASLHKNTLLDAGMLNTMIAYVSALMEVKSAMGVILAAPTAGACAALPGAVIGAADFAGYDDTSAARALLAGGMIGIFITSGATFSAEVGGCQAETGAAAGMTAAALTDLAGGTAEQALAAASIALQNSLGMICDPVANRVEVPCLGKNILAAANALSCANMALAGYDPVIPLDEVIETMDRVGRSLPRELCCTALGGLSITPTSRSIENLLKIRKP